jgi:hypothetical protein
MQNSQLPTIERQLKVKILSGVVLLLLVGLHPVRVFADAGSSNTTGTSSTADPTTSSNTTISGSATIPADTSSSNTPLDTANSSNTNGGSSTTGATPPSSTTNDQTDNSTATISNQTTSTASSGNTSVSGSSTGESPTSGNATAIATAINVLNSSTDVQGNNTNTYVDNITGDNNSNNVIIDPTTTEQPIDSQDDNKTEVNTASSGTIDNNVIVGASTGDANISDNEIGGNATSGNATADANLINVVSSEFTSGQYYVGVINILGNLSGNILLNPDFVNQLLAENPSILSGDTSATNSINQSINNAINASAISGDASIEHNLLGGDATSGNAETSVDSYNLVNDNITGNNAFLVFINVLGTWEGVIIGAPTGVTTAVYSDGASSQNTNSSAPQDQTQTSTNDLSYETINNTIDASALSGDATVEHNDQGGNATSGNAEVSVNLLNILNSNVSLSGWFGILFINVFGNWTGNFGIVTPPTTTSSSSDTTTSDTSEGGVVLADSIAREAYTIFDQSSIASPTPGQVLGATTDANIGSPNGTVAPTVATVAHTAHAWWLPAAAGFLLAIASLTLEQVIQRSRKNNSQVS